MYTVYDMIDDDDDDDDDDDHQRGAFSIFFHNLASQDVLCIKPYVQRIIVLQHNFSIVKSYLR